MEEFEVRERFLDFLNEFYRQEIEVARLEEKHCLVIDFAKLDQFDPELADSLLEEPEQVLSTVEKAVKESLALKLKLRITNLPEDRELRIRSLRAEHIGKLLVIEGIVKRASEVRPEVAEAIFTCPACGERVSVIQTERIIRPPIRCACGNTRGFRLIDQRLVDARWVYVEEPYELVRGERPSELMIYLKEDLTVPRMQSQTDPGNRIKIVGVLKQMARRARRVRTTQLEIYLEANWVEAVEVGWEEIEIRPEDEKTIKRLAADPNLYEKLIASFAPAMYGLDEVKEAIILQLFGGEPHLLPDGTRIRGNIHVLLVGDPAAGKSQLMQLAARLIPRGRYASGTAVTGAGITATVVRDEEFLGGWVLEAGALVLANKSLLALDEFTKISGADLVRLQEAMSTGTISIAKATIVATLPADTAILAGANPKLGRFDPYIPIREQLALNEVILSRFDLRFALKDVPNPEQDARMVEHILNARHFKREVAKPVIAPDLLRKYIAYARARCHPKLTPEAGQRLKEFYLKMRERSGEEAPISITLRQYEALIRLAEASARIRLSDRVEIKDAERAINLMKISLRQFGFEPETGFIDIDRAEGLRVTSAQRSKMRVVLDLFEELEAVHGKQVPIEELTARAKDAGIDDIDDILRRMMREGVIYSPRVGVVQRL